MEDNAMVTPEDRTCQSCAMPITTPDELGTNGDGSPHDEYCTFCFQEGEFTDTNLTLTHMIDLAAEMMVNDEGISEPTAKLAARESLASLKRWR